MAEWKTWFICPNCGYKNCPSFGKMDHAIGSSGFIDICPGCGGDLDSFKRVIAKQTWMWSWRKFRWVEKFEIKEASNG